MKCAPPHALSTPPHFFQHADAAHISPCKQLRWDAAFDLTGFRDLKANWNAISCLAGAKNSDHAAILVLAKPA